MRSIATTFNNHLDYTIVQENYIGLSTADFLVKFSTAFEFDPGRYLHQTQYQHYWARVQPSGLLEFFTLQVIDYSGNLIKGFGYVFDIITDDSTVHS